MTELAGEIEIFAEGARSFAELVRRIPAQSWDGPGLDQWDLRALVGHTSRSLITVITYLDADAEREDVVSAVDFYARVAEIAAAEGGAVVERGRNAGIELGADPAASVEELLVRTLDKLAGTQDRLIAVIGGLGIRLSVYLQTRIFELGVHNLDIARAIGVDYAAPVSVLDSAAVLAARIAVAEGQGATTLTALTGRASLPPDFSVV